MPDPVAGAVRVEVTGHRMEVELAADATRNALSSALVDDLTRCVLDASARRLGVLVIRSATPAFSAGFDLGSLEHESDATLAHRFLRIAHLLESIAVADVTSVAVLDGPAVGAGADLALACDHRIGTARASFRFPGAGFGLVLGTQRLAALVGQATALGVVTRGDTLRAPAAAAAGLMEQVEDLPAAEARVDALSAGAERLPDGTLADLRRAVVPTQHDSSLAATARSVVRPGLKTRVEAFVDASRRSRTPHERTHR